MLNLLINLKKYRSSSDPSAVSLLILAAFFAGAVLFRLFGKELYDSGLIEFSPKFFSVVFSAAMLIVILSAFSQLGPVQVAAADAVFEFSICCFALYELADGVSAKAFMLLLIKLFALIFSAMLISRRADISSIRLLSVLRSDRKRIADFALNSVILVVLVIILLTICLMAF